MAKRDKGVKNKEREGIRLNKLIRETGICSRREADSWIEQGRVTVNGKKASLGTIITGNEIVKVDGRIIQSKEEPLYLAFNKPIGITCTTEKNVKDNIVDYINYPQRIFPIGRLDKDSEGLIFLTNDGDIVNKILRAGNNHEKEYIVQVDKPITEDFIFKMGNGLPVLDTITLKCEVEAINTFSFRIVLVQGLNLQIRRMCEYLGYTVVKLKRIRIMNIGLKGIAPGEWREFTPEEINTMNLLLRKSSK